MYKYLWRFLNLSTDAPTFPALWAVTYVSYALIQSSVFDYCEIIFSQGNLGPPGIPGPVGAPGLGLQGEKVKKLNQLTTKLTHHMESYQRLPPALIWFVDFNLIFCLAGWSRPSRTCRPQRTSRYWNNRTKGKTGCVSQKQKLSLSLSYKIL